MFANPMWGGGDSRETAAHLDYGSGWHVIECLSTHHELVCFFFFFKTTHSIRGQEEQIQQLLPLPRRKEMEAVQGEIRRQRSARPDTAARQDVRGEPAPDQTLVISHELLPLTEISSKLSFKGCSGNLLQVSIPWLARYFSGRNWKPGS